MLPRSMDSRHVQNELAQARMVEEDGKRYIEGYGIVFNQESRVLGGWFVERILPESVERALEFEDITVDSHHIEYNLLGRKKSGTATFTVDEVGVKYRAEIPNTTYGNDIAELVKRGDIDGSSFVFTIGSDGDEWRQIEKEGMEIWERTVKNMGRIFSMGPVVTPAYPQTTAAMRSFNHYARDNNLTVRVQEVTDEKTGEKRCLFQDTAPKTKKITYPVEAMRAVFQ